MKTYSNITSTSDRDHWQPPSTVAFVQQDQQGLGTTVQEEHISDVS